MKSGSDSEKPTYHLIQNYAPQLRVGELNSAQSLEMGITALQCAVNLMPDTHPYKPTALDEFGIVLESQFQLLGHIVDLDLSVKVKQWAVKLTPSDTLTYQHISIALGVR